VTKCKVTKAMQGH